VNVGAPDETSAMKKAAAEFGVEGQSTDGGEVIPATAACLAGDVIAQRSSIRCCACERLIRSMRMAHLQLTYRLGQSRQL
jgi:hypothetical protein